MKTYEPRDLGDCIVMSETEGGGWCKVEDVAELVASNRRLVEAVKECNEAFRDNLSKYAYKNEQIMLTALNLAEVALAEAEEILK